MINKFSFSTIVATCFGVGFVPFAPGTFGSLLAFPLYFILTYLMIIIKGGISGLASPDLINSILVINVGLFFLGAWAADTYSRNTGKQDPKEVVIDEVVGQLLTICLVVLLLPYIGGEALQKIEKLGISPFNFALLNLLFAFIFFRIFDISKPWPINYIDKKYKNALGVMFDDVLAAIFAVFVHFFVLYAIIDRI